MASASRRWQRPVRRPELGTGRRGSRCNFRRDRARRLGPRRLDRRWEQPERRRRSRDPLRRSRWLAGQSARPAREPAAVTAPTRAPAGPGWGAPAAALGSLGARLELTVRVAHARRSSGRAGAMAMALAFAIFGKKRRDEEPPAPDEVLQAQAARGAGVAAPGELVRGVVRNTCRACAARRRGGDAALAPAVAPRGPQGRSGSIRRATTQRHELRRQPRRARPRATSAGRSATGSSACSTRPTSCARPTSASSTRATRSSSSSGRAPTGSSSARTAARAGSTR